MKLRRIQNMMVIIVFLAMIALPGVFFSAAPWTDHVENRVSAPFPGIPRNIDELLKFPAAFESYFNDHFGFRNPLIDLRHRVDFWIFGRSPNAWVLLGKENWLYYNDDRDSTEYYGKSDLDESDFEAWYRALKRRRDWLAARGIDYHFVVVPNKQSIYPEYLPRSSPAPSRTRLDRLIEYLAQKGEGALIDDLRPALIAAKASGVPVYQQIDIHWNDYGAYKGYRVVAKHIQRDAAAGIRLLDLPDQSFAPIETRTGSLADMMKFHPYPLRSRSAAYAGSPLSCGHQVENLPVKSYQPATRAADVSMECSEVDQAARAVIFGDSMLVHMMLYFFNSFAHVRFAFMLPTPGDVMRYVAEERPKVVVELRSERYLMDVPPEADVALAAEAAPPGRAGWVNVGDIEDGRIVVNGWGLWEPQKLGRTLKVNTNLPIGEMVLGKLVRPNVAESAADPRLADSGFRLQLYLRGETSTPAGVALCMWTEDPELGYKRLSYVNHKDWDRCPADD